MNNRLFTCRHGTILDLQKVTAIHPVTDEHNFCDAEWTYMVRLEGGDTVHLGSESEEETRADYTRLIEAWKNFVNGRA